MSAAWALPGLRGSEGLENQAGALVLGWAWKEGGLQLKKGENVDEEDSSVAKGHGGGVG